MAIIRNGILGGFNNKIGTVIGYNRLGKSIIVSKSSKYHSQLYSWMLTKNFHKKAMQLGFHLISTLNFNRFFKNSLELSSLDYRLNYYMSNWPKFKALPTRINSLLVSSIPTLTGLVTFSFNTTSDLVTVTWKNIKQPVTMYGNRYTYIYIRYLTQNNGIGAAVTTQDSRNGSYSFTGRPVNPKDIVVCHLGWCSTNIPNPSVITNVLSFIISVP